MSFEAVNGVRNIAEGKIILANRAAAEVCGSEVEEVIGRSIYSRIAPNDVVRVAELIRIALDHGLSVSNAQAVKRRCFAKYRGCQSELSGGADFSLLKPSASFRNGVKFSVEEREALECGGSAPHSNSAIDYGIGKRRRAAALQRLPPILMSKLAIKNE